MLQEDKLSHNERVRLEALAQAIAFNLGSGAARLSPENLRALVLADAKTFASFIFTNQENNGPQNERALGSEVALSRGIPTNQIRSPFKD